jgi:hypothetical protein
MSGFFRIEMLPAGHGDALWIEYGNADATNRILIDGGTVSTYPYFMDRLKLVPGNERYFELVVLTHVDADHVEGLLRMFADRPLAFTLDRVLFNGWRQMEPNHGLLGGLQGEFLSALLVNRARRAWNPDGPALVVPDEGDLPVMTLSGGMKLTLLSPSVKKLVAMAKDWKKNVDKVKLKPGDLDKAWDILAKRKKFLPEQGLLGATPELDEQLKKAFRPDQAKANGSSLAFLAEYAEKSALLLGDAHPDVITQSLRRLCRERSIPAVPVDVVKISHHGSKNNTSQELLESLRCSRYLVSTSGAYFDHPDEECIQRVIDFGHPTEMVFNYDSNFTQPWIGSADQHGYTARVRPLDALSIVTEL